jgi:hypothetical protein
MSAHERVSRASFSSSMQPISKPRPLGVLPGRTWSDEEWDKIQLGYRSRDMDEKWDVFAEGDVVYLHRSWTGNGIFEVTFAPVEGGGRRIVDAMVERNTERLRYPDDEHDCVMLELVLSSILLGEPALRLREKLVELTRRRPGAANAVADAVQHSALGLRSDG